jgi:MFS family permease
VSSRNRLPITALIVANAISLIGRSLTAVAVPWFVLETTGSAGKAGLSGAFAFLPSFFAGILGGTVVDRLGARMSAVVADLVSGLAILMVPLLYHTVGLEFWQLLILIMLSTMLDLPGLTARRSMLPDLASLGRVRLERVNAFLEGNSQIAFLLGPPLAGVLIAFMGASNVLWIDAGTSLVSAISILAFVPVGIHRAVARTSASYVADIKEGLRFLWRDDVIRWISLTLAITNAFGAPFFSLMWAVYAKDRFDDPRYLGLMLSASGVGMVIGVAFYGWIGFRVSRRQTMILFLVCLTVAYWPLATSLPFVALLILLGIGGLFDGPVNPMLVTVRLERIPQELRGRVFSATSAVSQIFPPATILLAGLLIEGIGLRATAIILAIGAQVTGIAIALLPVWRRLDETAPPEHAT